MGRREVGIRSAGEVSGCRSIANFQLGEGATRLFRRYNRMAATRHCTRSSRAFRSLLTPNTTQEITLPTFLVPAFARPQASAHFSSSSRCRSKIGRAPLSLPPEVTFRIFDAPPVKQGRSISRTEPSRKVEIEGPLGKMSLDIPSYINIASNEANRTYGLTILDTGDKQQKAMWGVYTLNATALSTY